MTGRRQFALRFLLLAGAGRRASAGETVTLGDSGGAVARIALAILGEAYARIGVTLATRAMPAERALRDAGLGLLDGSLTRVEGVEPANPDLIRIPVPICMAEAMVYTNTARFRVDGWESLRPYRIGVRLGIKFIEEGTSGMRVQSVPSNEQLFSKLELGRTDIAVATRIEGTLMMARLRTRHVHMLEPPVATAALYHYLHRKKLALVPRITETLRQMEREGRLEAIRAQVRERMLAEVGTR